MKNNYKNRQNFVENSINKSIYKKIEEILLITRVEIIKNNNITTITENIYYKIYNGLINYIMNNIDNINFEELKTNIKNIISNLLNNQ